MLFWFWLLTFVVCAPSAFYIRKRSDNVIIMVSMGLLIIGGGIIGIIRSERNRRVQDYNVQELFTSNVKEVADLSKQIYVQYGCITKESEIQLNRYVWKVLLHRQTGQAIPRPPVIHNPAKIRLGEYIYLSIVWIGMLTQIIVILGLKTKGYVENHIKKKFLDESENAEEFMQKIRQELETE